MNHEEKILHRLREGGGLSPGARLTLLVAELLWKQSGNDWAIITHAEVAAFTGASKDTVKEHLEHGERLGWFERKESRGHGWMYSFGNAETPAVDTHPSPLTPPVEGEGGEKPPLVESTPPRVGALVPGTHAHVHASPTPPPPTGGESSSGESELPRALTAAPAEKDPPQMPDFSEPIDLLEVDMSDLCQGIIEYQCWARKADAPSRQESGKEVHSSAWSKADVSALRRFISTAMSKGYEVHRVCAWTMTQLELMRLRDKPVSMGTAIVYLGRNLTSRKPDTHDELSPYYELAPAISAPERKIRPTEDYTEEEKRRIAAENDRGIDYMAEFRARMGGAK